MKSGEFLLAFVSGAVVGAVVGIMLAPDSGENTRHKIMDFAHDKSNEGKIKLKSFLDKHNIKLGCQELEELVDELVSENAPAKE